MTHWTILTCEYPPDCGGVGDYTAQVAAALAACGDTVTVFCPPTPRARCSADAGARRSSLRRRRGGRARRRLRTARPPRDRRAASNGRDPSTILVQYVPTGFGLRGANIPWCRWLLERSRRPATDVRVMFHEPYFEFTWRPLLQNALALAERLMAQHAAPRRLARVRVDRRVAPLSGAAHAAQDGRRARHAADSVGDSAVRSRARDRRAPHAAARRHPRPGSSAISAPLAPRSRRCSRPSLHAAAERGRGGLAGLRRVWQRRVRALARSRRRAGNRAIGCTVPAVSRRLTRRVI